MAYTAYSGDRKTILKMVDNLWEYQGENSLHAKTYLIDDRMAVIGSYNLDPRSEYIDTETCWPLTVPILCGRCRRNIWRRSLRVDGDGTYPKKVAIGTAKAPNGKRIVNGLLFLPTQLFKHLT